MTRKTFLTTCSVGLKGFCFSLDTSENHCFPFFFGKCIALIVNNAHFYHSEVTGQWLEVISMNERMCNTLGSYCEWLDGFHGVLKSLEVCMIYLPGLEKKKGMRNILFPRFLQKTLSFFQNILSINILVALPADWMHKDEKFIKGSLATFWPLDKFKIRLSWTCCFKLNVAKTSYNMLTVLFFRIIIK